jgi:transposase InsO family protein
MDQIVVDHGHRTDPHRRWLRHTYQEGPGFLFLSTRGGRPPKRVTPGNELAQIRRRARVLRVAREDGSQPNELWHIDIKGPFFIQLLERRYLKTWLVGLVDDHSRYVLGLRIQTSSQLAPILTWLRDCIELCGQPLAVMSDNGSPFVVWMPGVLTAFGKTLHELAIRHIRTQINSPWTNGKIERFWKLLQAEVLDRQVFRSLEEAEAALNRFAAYYNYHRLSGAIGWLTPAERFDGTPFTDRGFENIPSLEHLQNWLAELMRAA